MTISMISWNCALGRTVASGSGAAARGAGGGGAAASGAGTAAWRCCQARNWPPAKCLWKRVRNGIWGQMPAKAMPFPAGPEEHAAQQLRTCAGAKKLRHAIYTSCNGVGPHKLKSCRIANLLLCTTTHQPNPPCHQATNPPTLEPTDPPKLQDCKTCNPS